MSGNYAVFKSIAIMSGAPTRATRTCGRRARLCQSGTFCMDPTLQIGTNSRQCVPTALSCIGPLWGTSPVCDAPTILRLARICAARLWPHDGLQTVLLLGNRQSNGHLCALGSFSGRIFNWLRALRATDGAVDLRRSRRAVRFSRTVPHRVPQAHT